MKKLPAISSKKLIRKLLKSDLIMYDNHQFNDY